MKYKKYTVMDLFSGCGGFSLGMQNAGFHIIAAIDNDPFAIKTYKANFPSHLYILEQDLQKFVPQKIADLISRETVDIIIGGPPCQGFSTARKVDGSNHGTYAIKDKRRHLFKSFLYNVDYFCPKMFVMENVRGIRTVEGSRIFQEILRSGDRIGYYVHEILLSAWQYGVPQKRIRQIFFGVRKDMPAFSINEWVRPTHADSMEPSNKKKPVTLWEAIGDLPRLKSGQESNRYNYKRYRDHLNKYDGQYTKNVLQIKIDADLTAHAARFHSDRDLRDFAKLKQGETSAQALARGVKMEFPYNRDIFKDRYTRQHRHRISSTIVAHLSKDGLMFIHPTQNRSLTPREAARIQSFPDWFGFPVSQTHQYRLIGNAVPPLLGQAIGSALKRYLKSVNGIHFSRAIGE